MCLNKVTSLEQGGEGVGWKVFGRMAGKLCSPFQGHGTYVTGEWLSDPVIGNIFMRQTTKKYPTGFHLFTTRGDALAWGCSGWTVRQVKYRNQVACGTQGGFPVVVAREIRIRKSSRRS